jgi:hypothetical protein
MLSLGGPGHDRGRLIPVPRPRADNHDSPNALLLQHLPRAPGGRGDYQPGRLGQPDGLDAGLGSTPRHLDWRGQHDPAGSTTTARAAWLTRNGLAAHLTASDGPGPPRHEHQTPTRTGPTTTGSRSLRPGPVRPARPGSDSRTNATGHDPTSLGSGPGIRVSSSPSRPGRLRLGPSSSTTSGPRASCATRHHEPEQVLLDPGVQFPSITAANRLSFFPYSLPNEVPSLPGLPCKPCNIARSTRTLAP